MSCLLVGVQDILLEKSNEVDNQVLHVSKYYECLGPIPPDIDTTKPSGWIPKNVTVNALCPLVWNFLLTSSTSRGLVDTEMVGAAAVVDWGSYNDSTNSVELRCSLSHTIVDARNIAKTWDRMAAKALQDVLAKNFASEQLETLREAWQPLLGCVGFIDEIDQFKINVNISCGACFVSIAGPSTVVKHMSLRFKEEHAKMNEKMARAATFVTKMHSGLNRHQLRMLIEWGFVLQQQNKFVDLTMAIDLKSAVVRFTGTPADVALAKLAMDKVLSSVTEESVEMSASQISLLRGESMMTHIMERFKYLNIRAVYSCLGENILNVYALCYEHLITAIELIRLATSEASIDVDANEMFAPQKWTELMLTLQSEHDGLLVISRSQNAVVVKGEFSRVRAALAAMQYFIKQNVICDQFIAMAHGVAVYLHTFLTLFIDRIPGLSKHGVVTITAQLDGPYGYVATGNTYAVQYAEQTLRMWSNYVVRQQIKVDKPGMRKFLTRDAWAHSVERLNHKHKVIIEAMPIEKYADRAGSDGSGSVAAASACPDNGDVVARVSLPGGVTVEVVQGDLRNFRTDAIVIGADEQLNHFGSASVIVDAGNVRCVSLCMIALVYFEWGVSSWQGNETHHIKANKMHNVNVASLNKNIFWYIKIFWQVHV